MPGFTTWMHENHPTVHLPRIVMFYLHDADIRLREPEYRITQDEQLDLLIMQLEQGQMPTETSAGCAIALGWLGAGALLALMVTLAFFNT